MLRTLMSCVAVCALGAGSALADTLDISIAAQGANYNSMVRDAKLRGDGVDGAGSPWALGNIGNGSGGSNRFYANYLLDGVTSSGRMNTFIQWFDVSSIPAGSTINSATLTVYLANQSANGRTWENVKLSRLLAGNDWVEGVGQTPATDGSVTYNYRAAQTIPWAAPGAIGGADIDLGSTQTFNVVGVDGQATVIVRDISAWVQAWVNSPSGNAGLLWWGGNNADSGSGNRYFHFGTKEDGAGPAGETNAAAPMLVIDYTIPEPTTALLLAAGALFTARRRFRCSLTA